jgi:hypothetical protein
LTGTGFPLVIKAPKAVTAGRPLRVTVDYVDGSGAAVPLPGATVRTGRGGTATTNANGIATLRPQHGGDLTLRASKSGYIRAAARKVEVRS